MSQAAIDRLRRATDARATRSRPIPVITLPSGAGLFASGSLNVFVAHRGNGLIDQVRAAVSNPAVMAAVQARLDQALQGFSERDMNAAAAVAESLPVHGQIRLGERVLQGHIVLPPELPMAVFTFAYNGANLEHAGLTWTEAFVGDADELDVLGVAREPALTIAARNAISALNLRQQQKGVLALEAEGCEDHATATAVVTAALLTTAVAVRIAQTIATTTLLATNQTPTNFGLSDLQIAELGSEATAQRIVEAHRESLRGLRGQS